jgi:hypothetical protein
MKTKLITLLCIAAISFLSLPSAIGADSETRVSGADVDSAAAVTDVIIVRPVCFAATIIGAAFFVISLPASLPSRSVKKTADTLIGRPARATFSRPVGDFDYMEY